MSGGDEFADFVQRHEQRLRTALVLEYGADTGREAAAEALAWAWENWERVRDMESPVPYLFRVGQSRTRRIRRRTPPVTFSPSGRDGSPWVEPMLASALGGLSRQQRTCTVLVHCYGWTLAEVAELLGLSKSTVQTHVDRGLHALRVALAVDLDG